ncbi:MAG: hypothetical protein OXC68_15535 [Aestuariivita sp.]|nr:hypothetical protein [Aestuariivita sp.]
MIDRDEDVQMVLEEMKEPVSLPEFWFPEPEYIYGHTGMTYEETLKYVWKKNPEKESENQKA